MVEQICLCHIFSLILEQIVKNRPQICSCKAPFLSIVEKETLKKIVEKVNLLLVIFRVEFFTQIMNLVGIAFILEIVVDGPLF
jgi:hypothetical protein